MPKLSRRRKNSAKSSNDSALGPPASNTRTYGADAAPDLCCGQCHGCGKRCTPEDLRRCAKCKRTWYCSRECQALDWKNPHHHKRHCMEGLLPEAMDHIHRLDVDVKMNLIFSGQAHKVPNANINQTITKVSCPDTATLLASAKEELRRIEELSEMAIEEASSIPGSEQNSYTDHPRYGLDIGVQTLCLALNLWPGVFTVNSCSGLHFHASVPVGPDGELNPTPIVAYMSDDANLLAKIQAIVEKGALGIRFRVDPSDPTSDSLGGLEGFGTVACSLGEGKPAMCRAMCREIRLSTEPFDRLDDTLMKEHGGMCRIQNNIVGYFGLALELVKSNPERTLGPEENCRLSELQATANDLRTRLVTSGNQRLGLALSEE